MKRIGLKLRKLCVCSLFSIPGLFIFNNGYSQESQVFEGTTVVEQIYSPGLEGNLLGDLSTQAVKVYLPSGYDDFPENEYPVLYFLGGYTWDHNSYYDRHDMLNRLNQLIAQKTMPPMIIVTPNTKNKYDGCAFVNSYVTGNWEDYIVEDVIQGIESKYRILKQSKSRGLSGFSGGGYGATILGMKHSSLFNAVCIMAGAKMDFDKTFLHSPNNEAIISAVKTNMFKPSDPWQIRAMISCAAAYAPDSTAIPLLGRFPYDKDGVFIDSVWQKWILHDPIRMLETYKDSLLTIDTLQMYIGSVDQYHIAGHESFHLALLDLGIEHGYEVFEGGHTPGPVIDKALGFFSGYLEGVVPTIRSAVDYYLENTDTLVVEMDMDGILYIVPASAGIAADSIYKHNVATADAIANEETEMQLSDLEFGKYRVFAISSESAVSNIPEEFYVVPDKSNPIITVENDTIYLNDSINVSINRDGTIFLVIVGTTPDNMLIQHTRIKDSLRVEAGKQAGFPTNNLFPKDYLLYAKDDYGLWSEAYEVSVVEASTSSIVTPATAGIHLFPNPVSDLLNIQIGEKGLYHIEISSSNGQQILIGDMHGTTHQIDLSSFQKGVYFITIRSKDFVNTRKIIKY